MLDKGCHYEWQLLDRSVVRLKAQEQDRRAIRACCGKHARKVAILRYEHAALLDRSLHYLMVISACEPKLAHVRRVDAFASEQLSESPRNVVIEQERYSLEARGSSLLCRFSAAYSRASRMSAASRSGCESRISAVLMPFATIRTTVATGIRKPRMHGAPPICSGRTVMRGNGT